MSNKEIDKELEKTLDDIFENILEELKEIKKETEKDKKESKKKRTDKEIYQDRLSKIKEQINNIIKNSEVAIICVGDGGMMSAGTGNDILALLSSAFEETIKDREIPREKMEWIFEKILEHSYDD